MSKKRIAYKVVHKDYRWGSNLTIYASEGNKKPQAIQQLLDALPSCKPYFPTYIKGATITAVPGSVGILCFESEKHCHNFMFKEDITDCCSIIKVRLIGRINKNVRLVFGAGSHPMHILNIQKEGNDPLYFMNPPTGSIAVPAVEVLE